MAGKLRWGILATGRIAGTFAKGVQGSKTGTLVAVGSRSAESADKFAGEYGIPNRHGSYASLLADDDVDAVYIATPHPMHAEWAIKAADAGKHLLVEKPIGLNHAEAMAIIEAARANDVFCMEAFMYRCHPQTHKVVELIRAGEIGEVRIIQASFSFNAGRGPGADSATRRLGIGSFERGESRDKLPAVATPPGFSPDSRIWSNALAGGGIMDVGCYCTSMARLVAGAAAGKDFAEPVEVKAIGRLHPETGVDSYTAAIFRFPGDLIAQLSTGVGVGQDNQVRIYGTEGSIVIPSPWIVLPGGGKAILRLTRGGKTKDVAIDVPEGLYSIEADTVAANIDARQAPAPAMSWDDTLGNMKALDRWRDAIGLVFEAEKPENVTHTVHRRPLERRDPTVMKYARIPGVEKDLSRLVMGCDNQTSMSHAAVMWDDFIERGGNTFDTGYIYGGGAGEKLLGQWMQNRGVREEVAVISKGAHTPHCNPRAITKHLDISLERLQTGHADIYFMHRDNPDVPVGEFVDVLNEHHRAGRIKVFGGSNWSRERIDAANAYARKKNLQGFSVLSNNFSLARLIEPPWTGCQSAWGPEWREWLIENEIHLFPWSSQARGFFTGRAHPDDKSDPELVRCWYAADNFQRLERVNELAEKRGCLAISIALSFVLHQRFLAFPLFGPRQLSETRTSFEGLSIELSEDEVKWLNLED